MSYDLVIRGGTVVDGSGLPRYRADVGIRGDRIARIGTIHARGREEVDARHRVVAPGFIDGHTHMDAQVAWDPLGTCSCWHGVTSVVMGNCGFTLAPCRPDEKHLVVRNLERAEDIPAEAMQAGIEWTWETYAQYLDAVARWPKGINYAGYVGHSTVPGGPRSHDGRAPRADCEHRVRRRPRRARRGRRCTRAPRRRSSGSRNRSPPRSPATRSR
jgi:N-acyl-D-amino-acid deacylase